MLTFTFLGVGSMAAKRNFQSNVLVEAWDRGIDGTTGPVDNMLIDLGSTGPLALHRLNDEAGFEYLSPAGTVDYGRIRRVFATHLHGDHVGGLEELALVSRYNRPGAPRIELVAAEGVLETLWEATLRGSLGQQEGGAARLEDYFVPRPLALSDQGAEAFVVADRYRFEPVRTDHITIARKYDWPTFGLVVTDLAAGEEVVYSGDTRLDPEGLARRFTAAKMIFHDVQLASGERAVHATLSSLRSLASSIKKKMILYHFEDNWDDPEYDYVSEEFAGFAVPRSRYTVFGTEPQ